MGERGLSLLKRSALAIALILVLLFSVLTGTLFIDVGESTIPAPSGSHAFATILSPKDKAYLTNPVNLTVSGYSHYWNVNLIEYRVDNGSWVILYQNRVYAGWTSVIDRYISLNLSQGIHTITAKVSAGPYYDICNVTIVAGIVTPYITILSPENKTYSTTEIPLIFEIPDLVELSSLQYVLDGNQRVFVSENSSLKGLSEGVHNLIVYGIPVFGTNYGSDTIYFSVNVPFPTVPVTIVVAVAVIVVCLLVYFKKRKH
jgi:hypothetical protein